MDCPVATDRSGVLGTIIVSEVRFLRESLAEILQRTQAFEVRGQSATLADALVSAEMLKPAIILLDAAFPAGIQAATQLALAIPQAGIVAFAVSETEENVLAWAEAGIAGYVPNTASVDDLVALIGQISRGEQACPSHIAGSLLRRVAGTSRASAATSLSVLPLTRRELEILRLLGAGLGNKDIARRLGISVGTTKSHVHNLLGKLNIQRRTEVITHMHAMRHGLLRPTPA
jgi:two-component system nitrate/nitrite response regulator NarL